MKMNSDLNEKFMLRAIELAKKGTGKTDPNPLVGAVIVKDSKVIAEGYHEKYGDLHAERNALKNLKNINEAKNATIYVTLEPCCHQGKQPPCTEALIDAGIGKVVIGSFDPNPLVSGKGIKILRDAGIEVVTGYMKKECDELNPFFFHFIKYNTPYVALKYAMTADGKIATKSGDSKWITGEAARRSAHELRKKYYGILAGINTVEKDDPMLDVRLPDEPGARNPVRIVLDDDLRISTESRILKTAGDIPTYVVTIKRNPEKAKDIEDKGAHVLLVSKDETGRVAIAELLNKLGEMKIDSILVEGGGEVNSSFIKAGAVNKVYVYIGNRIFGGRDALSPITGEGTDKVKDALSLSTPKVSTFEDDVLIEYDTKKEEDTCLRDL